MSQLKNETTKLDGKDAFVKYKPIKKKNSAKPKKKKK